MIVISDIDGTLCPSVFTNDNASKQDTPEFQAELLAVPLLPWFVDHGIMAFKTARVLIFVTGRGPHLNPITFRWIKEKIKATSFQVINTQFINYEQYIAAKCDALAKVITHSIQSRLSNLEMIHVLEDDERILACLSTFAPKTPALMVHAITKGKHSIKRMPTQHVLAEVPYTVQCDRFLCGEIVVIKGNLTWHPTASSDPKIGKREVATVRCPRCGAIKYLYRAVLPGHEVL